jgi:adenylosuccinate synthase
MVRIEEMRFQFEKEILPLETKLQTHYSELRLMYAKNQEQAKIDAKLNQIDKMEIELERRFEAHQMNIRNLLTDEQKMLFDQEGGFGMGLGMDYGRGYGQYYGRGYGRGPGMGRGFRCPWFWR